jgi:hypothetical protein
MTEGKNSTREESKEDCVRYNVGIVYKIYIEKRSRLLHALWVVIDGL